MIFPLSSHYLLFGPNLNGLIAQPRQFGSIINVFLLQKKRQRKNDFISLHNKFERTTLKCKTKKWRNEKSRAFHFHTNCRRRQDLPGCLSAISHTVARCKNKLKIKQKEIHMEDICMYVLVFVLAAKVNIMGMEPKQIVASCGAFDNLPPRVLIWLSTQTPTPSPSSSPSSTPASLLIRRYSWRDLVASATQR